MKIYKILTMGSGGAGGFRCKICGAHSGDKICGDCKAKM
jgi:hypothetical protein